MDSGGVEFSGAVDFAPDTNSGVESGGTVEKSNTVEVTPAEDIHFHSSNIVRADSSEYFDKPEDRERKKREEQRRIKAEAKRILKEARANKKAERIKMKQTRDKHVPMSTEKRSYILRTLAIVFVIAVAVGAIGGVAFLVVTHFRAVEAETTARSEERMRTLEGISSYYADATDEEIIGDAEKIYNHLGDIYNKSDDDEIRLGALYKRIELLYGNESFASKLVDDAEVAEKLDHSAKSAGWLVALYSAMGNEAKANEYRSILRNRAAEENGDDNGEG